MTHSLLRLHQTRTMNWRALVGIISVPLIAAGLLLWGLWNPTERLDQVTAAVVNLDEPVTIDGQIVPLGRVLAAELIDSEADTNFTWVLSDEADAAEGIADGRYASVVTIPRDFSATATSVSKGAAGAEQATIDIMTSERGRLLDAALSNIVTSTATTVLNQQLGAQYTGGVLVGLSKVGDGVREAADGASQLADATAQLADGASGLATGTSELATGANQLASGASSLASGSRQAANGAASYAAGVQQYVDGVNGALGQTIASAPQTAGLLQMLKAAVDAGTVPPPTGLTQAEFSAQLGQAIAALGNAGAMLNPLIDAGNQIAAGGWALSDGQAQLATGTESLSSGVAGVAAGASSLATGTSQFADGMRQAADGTSELASGLQQAGEEIPAYTQEEAEQLAEVGVQPVAASAANDELFNAGGVPLFAGIALWAGAFASFIVLAPLWRRTKEAARSSWFIAARSALPAISIGAIQGGLLGAILPPLLGYDSGQWISFFALSTLAGVSFSLVTQGLSALLGGVGRFVSFVLLVIAFAVGVISTAPAVLQQIGDASPIGALFEGFQSIATGIDGAGLAATQLVVWAAFGFVLTVAAVARTRRASLVAAN